MLKVGLTGSIAVGKSFVTGVFADLGAHVIDADQTARAVVAPQSAGWQAIVAAFGEGILQPDGTLDRVRLGAIVFADAAQRQILNDIVHPLVQAAQDEALARWAAADPHGVGLIDAALMIESGGYRRFDKIVVVHCRPELQLARLMQRNNLSAEVATQRIAAQMSQTEKMRYADYLIDTSEGFAATQQQTAAIYRELKELAARE